MKKLSETYNELGIAFKFPIKIKDANGNTTYFESKNGSWLKRKYDANGNQTCFEESEGDWWKREHDNNGNPTYYENSDGTKIGTPRSAKTCEGKVVEVDGIKYELKAL